VKSALAERIGAPTLVVRGRQDRLVDVRLAPRTARSIRDSRLLLDGAGHAAQLEVPRILARAVLAFLDEARSALGADPERARQR